MIEPLATDRFDPMQVWEHIADLRERVESLEKSRFLTGYVPRKPFCGECDHYHDVGELHGIATCEVYAMPHEVVRP